jgi:predicted RNase H-like nuclease
MIFIEAPVIVVNILKTEYFSLIVVVDIPLGCSTTERAEEEKWKDVSMRKVENGKTQTFIHPRLARIIRD